MVKSSPINGTFIVRDIVVIQNKTLLFMIDSCICFRIFHNNDVLEKFFTRFFLNQNVTLYTCKMRQIVLQGEASL